VCTRSYVSNGLRGLEVQSYHTIGYYRLTHRWVFWENGRVFPRLYSAGLQCHYNHRHHAYWRFDFDIDDAHSDLLLEYQNDDDTNYGWGRGWQPFRSEASRTKHAGVGRVWAVIDKSSTRGYYIQPGPNDGLADGFSTRDLWVLRYQASEDRHGRQGSAHSDDLWPYLNNEDVDGQDVVVWYAGHLSHMAHAGGDEWHYVGPTLTPFRWI